MYDIKINQLRKDLKFSPKKSKLLNEIYLQIAQKQFPTTVKIILPPDYKYSSKLKKTIVNLLGYTVKCRKISNEFEIYRSKQ